MKLHFREANQEDVPMLAGMMERFYQIDQYAFDKVRTTRNLLLFVSNPALGRLWCIEAGEQLAGYVALTFGFSFEFGGRNAFLDELFIEATYRGQGIGTAAIRFVLEQAALLDVQAVHLEVEKHNEAAQQLYRKHGFKDHNRYLMTCKIS